MIHSISRYQQLCTETKFDWFKDTDLLTKCLIILLLPLFLYHNTTLLFTASVMESLQSEVHLRVVQFHADAMAFILNVL